MGTEGGRGGIGPRLFSHVVVVSAFFALATCIPTMQFPGWPLGYPGNTNKPTAMPPLPFCRQQHVREFFSESGQPSTAFPLTSSPFPPVPLSLIPIEARLILISLPLPLIGSMLEFFSEAGQSTTAFGIDKPNLIVTSIAIDLDGNVWTGHMKVWMPGMECVGYGPHHV